MSRAERIASQLRPVYAREAAAVVAALEEAAAEGRRSAVRDLAHRLIGTAGTVDEQTVVNAARALQDAAGDDGVDDAVVRALVGAVAAAVSASVHPAEAASPDGEAARRSSGAAAAVVVSIDDDPAIRKLLARMLAGVEGIEVVTAATGVEGARLVRERAATLVLLDMNLPDVSGEWVLDTLRAPGGGLVARVVALTGDDAPGDRERAARLGVADYVVKPFDVDQLRALVLDACAATPP